MMYDNRECIESTLKGMQGCHQFFDDDSKAMLFTVQEVVCKSTGKMNSTMKEGHRLLGPIKKRLVCVCVMCDV